MFSNSRQPKGSKELFRGMPPRKRMTTRYPREPRGVFSHNSHQSADAHFKEYSHPLSTGSTKLVKNCTQCDSNRGLWRKMSDSPLDKNIEFGDGMPFSRVSASRQDRYSNLNADFGHVRNGQSPDERDTIDMPNSSTSTEEHSRNINERNTKATNRKTTKQRSNEEQKSNEKLNVREININQGGEEHFHQYNYLGGHLSRNRNDLSSGERDTNDILNASTPNNKENGRNMNERNTTKGEKSNRNRDERTIDINQGVEELFHYASDPYISNEFAYSPVVLSPLYVLARPHIPIPTACNHPNKELPWIYPNRKDGNYWIANNSGNFRDPLPHYPPGPANYAQVGPSISYVQMAQIAGTQQSDSVSTPISHSSNNVNHHKRSQTTPNATIRLKNLKEDDCYNVKIELTSSSKTILNVNKNENELEELAGLKLCHKDSRSGGEDTQFKPGSDCSKNVEHTRSPSDIKRPSNEERMSPKGRAYTSSNNKSGESYYTTHSANYNPGDERSLVQDIDRVKIGQRSAKERTGRDSYVKFSDMQPQSMQTSSPNHSALTCDLPRRFRYPGQATNRTEQRWLARDLSDNMNRRSNTGGNNTSRDYENYGQYLVAQCGKKMYKFSEHSDNVNNHSKHFRKTSSPRTGRDVFVKETSVKGKFGPSDEGTSFSTDTVSRGRYEREQSQRQTDVPSHLRKVKGYRYELGTPPSMETSSQKLFIGYFWKPKTSLQENYGRSDEKTSADADSISNGRYVVTYEYPTEVRPSGERTSFGTDTTSNGRYVVSYEYPTEVGPSDQRTSIGTDTISNSKYVASMQPSNEHPTEVRPSDERISFDTHTTANGKYVASMQPSNEYPTEVGPSDQRTSFGTDTISNGRYVASMQPSNEYPTEVGPSDQSTSFGTDTISNGRYVASMQPSNEYPTEVGPSDQSTSCDTDTISNGRYVASTLPSNEYPTEVGPPDERTSFGADTISNGRYVASMQPSNEYPTEVGSPDERTSFGTDNISNGRYVASTQPSNEYPTEVGPPDDRTSCSTDTISNGRYVANMQPSYEYHTEAGPSGERNAFCRDTIWNSRYAERMQPSYNHPTMFGPSDERNASGTDTMWNSRYVARMQPSYNHPTMFGPSDERNASGTDTMWNSRYVARMQPSYNHPTMFGPSDERNSSGTDTMWNSRYIARMQPSYIYPTSFGPSDERNAFGTDTISNGRYVASMQPIYEYATQVNTQNTGNNEEKMVNPKFEFSSKDCIKDPRYRN